MKIHYTHPVVKNRVKAVFSGRNRTFLFVFMMAVGVFQVQGQFLHFGISGSAKRMTFRALPQESNSTYTVHFANTENESLQFDGFDKQADYFYAPAVFVRYNAKNNFFSEFNFSVNRPVAVARYKNSVSYGTFNATFNTRYDSLNTASQLAAEDQYSYNQLSLKWTFLEASVTAGYSFLRTKLIRPSVYAGLALRYRMAMNLTDYPDDPLGQREMRTKILYENLDTFRNWTFYYLFGGGIRYHQFSLNVFLGLTSIKINGKPTLSLGDIDINEKNRGSDASEPSTSFDRDIPNYDSAKVWGFSLGIDLVSLNLTKKDVKQKVKTFRQ